MRDVRNVMECKRDLLYESLHARWRSINFRVLTQVVMHPSLAAGYVSVYESLRNIDVPHYIHLYGLFF